MSIDAETARQQMGMATARLMDLADDELIALLQAATHAAGRLDALLVDRDAPISQRISTLIGAALSPIVRDITQREEQQWNG